MKTVFWMGAVLGVLAGSVWGNGGGYHYGVRFTGTVKPFEPSGVEKVAILEEKLEIELGRSEAVVKVRYRMKNMEDQGVTARFGFPVEVADETRFMIDREPGTGLSAGEALKMVEGSCGRYRIAADGTVLGATFLAEEASAVEEVDFPFVEQLRGIGGWMRSELRFKGGEERTVEISYVSKYEVAGGSVSEDWAQGAAKFKYRLSTGAVWHGPIRRGVVTVTARGVDPDEVEIFKPVGKFQRNGSTWTWSFKDLEPSLAEDLEIHASPAQSFVSGGYANRKEDPWGVVGYLEQRGVWSKAHRHYEATASSTLPPGDKLSYGAANVRGFSYGDDYRAWSEGAKGDGLGEWLELKTHRAMPLFGIRIQPGYGKSEHLFEANNRPKRVEVELNGEHRFEAILDDRDESQMVRVKGYAKPVERVRITIREVYRGARYRDTCVSDVILYARLRKKPEIQGAR